MRGHDQRLEPAFHTGPQHHAAGLSEGTHSHTRVCRGTYVARGRIRFFFGTPDNPQIIDAEEGDYIYTPVGEIHSQLNLSETDPAEYVSTYVGGSDRNELGTVPAAPVPNK
jgi:uncharacterized RmlC-like cupin family protein